MGTLHPSLIEPQQRRISELLVTGVAYCVFQLVLDCGLNAHSRWLVLIFVPASDQRINHF